MKINHAASHKEINFELINKQIESGLKLRLDIGTSINAPVSKFWLDSNGGANLFVIGFEPNPDCLYKDNLWNNQILNLENVLGNHLLVDHYYHIVSGIDNVFSPTKSKLFLTTNNTGCSSLLPPKIENIHGCELNGEIEVDIIPMHWFLNNIKYNLIEMVKIDAQGKDLDIVKSFGPHLNNIAFLDVEGDSTKFYEGAPGSKEIIETIEALGFKCYDNLIDNYRFVNIELDIPSNFNNMTGCL